MMKMPKVEIANPTDLSKLELHEQICALRYENIERRMDSGSSKICSNGTTNLGFICPYYLYTNYRSIYLMAGLKILTEPVQEPVTLQEVKEYLRVDDSTDERIIRPFIETARRFCEEHTGRALMTQTLSFIS